MKHFNDSYGPFSHFRESHKQKWLKLGKLVVIKWETTALFVFPFVPKKKQKNKQQQQKI